MLRFRVRTLMAATAALAIVMGSVGPARWWYRRWSYYRSEAAMYSKYEANSLAKSDAEQHAADRAAIRLRLTADPEKARIPADEMDRAVDDVVEHHRLLAAQFLTEAWDYAERRRESEHASFWAFDPSIPDAPLEMY